VGRQDYGAGSTYVGGVIDIGPCATTGRAPVGQLDEGLAHEPLPDIYEKPIYSQNLYLKRAP